MEKKCINCGTDSASKWYKGPLCKNCYQNSRYVVNREKILELKRQEYQKNTDQIKQRQAKWRANHREYAKNKSKAFYNNNKELVLEKKKEYYIKNKEKLIKKSSEYSANNRDRVNESHLKRHHARAKTDVCYKIAKYLRTRLCNALHKNCKTGSAVRDLGCSIEELKIHLESQFQPEMNWDNYGSWHIDHIIPLSSFDLTDKEQLLKACNYTNLQPLWAKDNLSKGAKLC